MTRKLTEIYAIREDKVATRALTDLIAKAVSAGDLSDAERKWASTFSKAIEKSGPDTLTYPKLSFADSGVADRSGRPDKTPQEPEKVKKVQPISKTKDADQVPPSNSMDQAQSAWDSFANLKPAGDTDIGGLGSAGKSKIPVPPAQAAAQTTPKKKQRSLLNILRRKKGSEEVPWTPPDEKPELGPAGRRKR